MGGEVGGSRRIPPLAVTAAVLVTTVLLPALLPALEVSAVEGAQEPPERPDALMLYSRDCVSCHGPTGEGSPRGPSLVDAGGASAYYMLATGRMPIDEPRRSIERGQPAYAEEQIDALVDLVASFGPGGVDLPDVDPARGDVATGGVLYRRLCSGCHGVTGVGGSLAFDAVAPPVLRSSPDIVAAAVVHGPGTMPSFGDLLSDHELDSLTAHVQGMGDPVDVGGHPLARSGRVDEALMGWGVALGALVLTGVWLARRPR